MAENRKGDERNSEIVLFFYTIFGNRVHEGVSPEEARQIAYDAVSLRYGIGKGRLLNIISEKRCSPSVNIASFRANASALIADLYAMNDGLSSFISRNVTLIELLQECIDGK